jgi:hypothetical protein
MNEDWECEKIIAPIEMLYFRGVRYWKTKIVVCFGAFRCYWAMFSCLYLFRSLSNASNFTMFCNCGHKHQTCLKTCYFYKVSKKDSSNVHMKFMHKKCWIFKWSSFSGCNFKLCHNTQYGPIGAQCIFEQKIYF